MVTPRTRTRSLADTVSEQSCTATQRRNVVLAGFVCKRIAAIRLSISISTTQCPRREMTDPVSWRWQHKQQMFFRAMHYSKITWIISLGSSFLGTQHRSSSSKVTPQNLGGIGMGSLCPAISMKYGNIRPKLLLITNRKLHSRFRLIPKLTTLDDLERPLRAVFQNICVFGAHQENFNEDRPYNQHWRYSLMILVSDNIRFMRIFAWVLWRGSIKRQYGVIVNVDFVAFGRYIFETLGNKANIIISYFCSSFPLTPKYMTLNDLEWPWMVILHYILFLRRIQEYFCLDFESNLRKN